MYVLTWIYVCKKTTLSFSFIIRVHLQYWCIRGYISTKFLSPPDWQDTFLDAFSHLYKKVCRFVRPLVCRTYTNWHHILVPFLTKVIISKGLKQESITIWATKRGSKIGIAKKVWIEGETSQLQCYAVDKGKELGKWDCARIKELWKSLILLMLFLIFKWNEPIKSMLEVITDELFSLNFGDSNYVTLI